MGAGGSLEAAYTLGGPIPAGTWTLVADGIVYEPVDMTFEILLRADGSDTVLASFEQSFEPLPGGEFTAQAYERSEDLAAVEASSGDQLVLRFTGESATAMGYVPNGGGTESGGQIPHVDLPPD